MPLDIGATTIQAAPYLISVVIVVVFLRFLGAERRANNAVWENHLSKTVESLTRILDEQRRQGDEAREHYRGEQRVVVQVQAPTAAA